MTGTGREFGRPCEQAASPKHSTPALVWPCTGASWGIWRNVSFFSAQKKKKSGHLCQICCTFQHPQPRSATAPQTARDVVRVANCRRYVRGPACDIALISCPREKNGRSLRTPVTPRVRSSSGRLIRLLEGKSFVAHSSRNGSIAQSQGRHARPPPRSRRARRSAFALCPSSYRLSGYAVERCDGRNGLALASSHTFAFRGPICRSFFHISSENLQHKRPSAACMSVPSRAQTFTARGRLTPVSRIRNQWSECTHVWDE